MAEKSDRLLTPNEVAKLFKVHAKTPGRWAKAGKISSVRTPGGHRRYWEWEVRELLKAEREGNNEHNKHQGGNVE